MKWTCFDAFVAACLVLPAWGGGDSNNTPWGDGTRTVSGGDVLDRCALLNATEVEGAIGVHDGGKSGEGEWGAMGCLWTATTVQEVSGFPNGWRDAIEVAVFDEPMILEWARSEASGEPVAEFVDGAVYDVSYGNLWFPCKSQMCVVKARTNSGDHREEIATRLARLVAGRL